MPELLRELATDRGMAWADIADLVGVSVAAIRKWRTDGGATADNRARLAFSRRFLMPLRPAELRTPLSGSRSRCPWERAIRSLRSRSIGAVVSRRCSTTRAATRQPRAFLTWRCLAGGTNTCRISKPTMPRTARKRCGYGPGPDWRHCRTDVTDLDGPEQPGDLYQARGDVPLALPIMQGDVYGDVSVPGLSDKALTVAVVMTQVRCWPAPSCARKSPSPPSTLISGYVMMTGEAGHVNVMPLPQLWNTADWYAIDFRDIAAIPSGSLSRRSRIAACSRQGISPGIAFRLPPHPACGAVAEPA